LTAAIASIEASDFAAAERWLVTVEALPLDDMSRALVDRLRGWHAHARGQIRDVPPLLLRAAKRLGPLDARAARDAHLEALAAACDLGRFGPEGGVQDAARAALAAPPAPGLPNQRDLLLDGEALMITDGFPAAVPLLSQASVGFRSKEMSPDEAVRWGGYPIAAATMLWDGDGCLAFAARWVTVAREHGAVTMLPLALNALAMAQMFEGNLVAAGMSIAEAQSINEAAGLHAPPHAASFLAALRGREADAVASIEATVDSARTTGRGLALATAQHAIAVLYNGLGRHDKALAAAEDASLNPPEWAAHLMLPEYIEAAVRIGKRDAAAATLERLAETTRPNDSDWARGIQARSEALLSGGDMAEASYREAIDRLSRTQIRPELARAHLLYGEWVRRQDRQKDAREHLRTAHEMLSEMGLVAFAERARRELISAGGAVRTRSIETSVVLTPQELQIARLATDGRSNPEIGSQLFISPRTVEWHLHKAFTKLNVTSRRELRDAMSTRPS
jgi:ATP/maltotriose-dependent transcriptional regulator MalT